MKTQAQVVSQLREVLRVVEPDLDTTAGSVTRKILDAVAEAIAEVHVDQYMLDYRYDIDAKSGSELDDFISLFGFHRHPPRRAVGSVTFSRTSPTDVDIYVPYGTQVATEQVPAVIVTTTVNAVMRVGDSSVDVPVRAVEGGSRGNVASGTLVRRATPLAGITSVTNPVALSGGTDAESDASLRERFRQTVFRSLSGTAAMYLGVALDDPDVTQANVIGASKRHREQVEVVSGTAISGITDAAYIYPDSSVVGEDIDGGDILVPTTDYIFNDSVNPPTITDNGGMPDGIYDLDFEYLPNASRNDIGTGITNRVDIWLWGERAVEATETLVFLTTEQFVNSPGDPLHFANFEREDGTNPAVGNYFIRYGFTPLVDPSTDDQLLVGANTYSEDTDYFMVRDITNRGGAFGSRDGAELVSAANGGPGDPVNNSTTVVTHVFNEVPRAVASAINQWALLTTDVKVHLAKPIRLNVYLVVVYDPGIDATSVEDDIFAAIDAVVSGVGFSSTVQPSDILAAVHAVGGVDAVRFATSTDDATNYAVQRVANDGTTVLDTYDDAGGRVVDVVSDDDELPVLNDVVLDRRALNTFAQGQ